MNEERLAGPRMLTFGCLFGVIFWAAIFLGLFIYSTNADHVACSRPALSWPRTVIIRPDAPDPQAWRNALAEWNAQGTVVQFQEVAQNVEADVYILGSSSTWVQLPCGRTDSVVYAGWDVDLNYWATHEMGHTLGLADHITSGTDPSRYISPGYCPGGYSGVMSYCTPRSQWWGADDRNILWWWF